MWNISVNSQNLQVVCSICAFFPCTYSWYNTEKTILLMSLHNALEKKNSAGCIIVCSKNNLMVCRCQTGSAPDQIWALMNKSCSGSLLLSSRGYLLLYNSYMEDFFLPHTHSSHTSGKEGHSYFPHRRLAHLCLHFSPFTTITIATPFLILSYCVGALLSFLLFVMGRK